MELRKKEFKFKSKTIEELKQMDVREFASLLTAQQRRYTLRNFQTVEDFLNISRVKVAKNKQIKTHSRYLVIVPEMVGWRIFIYRGNSFEPVDITGEMLGHKLGEFALTRKKVMHVKLAASKATSIRK